MIDQLSKFYSNRAGNIAVTGAIALMVMVVAGSAVIDVSQIHSQKSKLQDAADSGALSGALALSEGLGNGKVKNQIDETIKSIIFETNNKALKKYKAKIKIYKKTETVKVDLSVKLPRLFSLGNKKRDTPIFSTATATVVYGDQPACVHVLDRSGIAALQSSGQGQIHAPACKIQVNSSSPNAVLATSVIEADETCIQGSFSGSGFKKKPKTMCEPKEDPYAALNIPVGGACDHNNYAALSSDTLYPGVYCGGIKLSNSDKVILKPGIYFIRDGKLSLSASASLIGEDVTLVLEGSGTLQVAADGDFVLNAPESGPLAGFSIIQSPTAGPNAKSNITAKGNVEINGVIYTPTHDWSLTGQSTSSANAGSFGELVVHRLKVSGQGKIHIGGDGHDAREKKDTVRLID